jgi:glycosyltransferase involved in cell wall biosynthesis
MVGVIADSHALADALLGFTVDTVTALRDAHLPDWRIPRSFAGHAVDADVRADLLFTLTHLAHAGVTELAGDPIEAVIADQLRLVDGARTHTFFSYRVAETLLRRGPYAANPLLAGASDAQREEVARATDSTGWIELLDAGKLPRNYAAVLSRVELRRHELGLAGDETLAGLVERLHAVLGENPRHFLDDSHDGSGRFDIYTVDIWLFCEPLAPRLGSLWADGARAALGLVDTVAGPDGAAIPWGRSTGMLATALTVELAALALRDGLRDDRAGAWVRRGVDAFRATAARFGPDGVCDAHRSRNQDSYRGPARRLQLTLDVLGKLGWAATTLRAHDPVAVATPRDTYRPFETLVELDPDGTASAWVHATRGRRVVVPFVGPSRSHYQPALHDPGTFEVPVDNEQVVIAPLVITPTRAVTTGEVPDRVVADPGRVTASWERLSLSGRGIDTTTLDPLPGRCRTTIAVERRTVVVSHDLALDEAVSAIAMQVPETARAPLAVELDADAPHATTVVDVDGIAEWSSPYSGLVRVHQIDLDPSARARLTARITPRLRVASTAFGHWYDRLLYTPIADRVLELASPLGIQAQRDVDLADVELLHLHWPEWFGFDDLATHEHLIATLADRGIPVVWTAHNLTPHDRRPDVYDPIYQRWAETVDGVIHHTEWGRARMLARYRFGPDCRHETIPHGHFGDLWPDVASTTRAEAEARLGLPPAAVRIGLVGAPRADKRVDEFLAGVVACDRDDIQVVCWSLAFGQAAPDDPRVAIAEQYRHADDATYATRLAACDAIALPFDPDGDMLATGTVADAIGVGLPALVSDWPFVHEMLGDAGITVGHTAPEIAAALDVLTPARLATARAAMAALRPRYDWQPIADRTFDLFERVVLDEP